ncbi:MAG TPA: murein transglycosylase A [Phaeodactylibacter sp.]|nr:murein transglycosylase A [Phaeodactylibacter sp.]
MRIQKLLFGACLCGLLACESTPDSGSLPIPTTVEQDSSLLADNAYLLRNGKIAGRSKMTQVYEPFSLDSLNTPFINNKLLSALKQNERLLHLTQGRRNYRLGNLRVNYKELQQTVDILKSWQFTKPLGLSRYLDAYQIWGNDRFGNVRFTGYYTPVIKVSRAPDETYRYPIYSRPLDWKGPLPTRAQIESKGLLSGKGLELAYAADKVDIYYMQLQGSGYVEYPDGSRELFSYNGTNRHPYRSIEKYLLGRKDLDVPRLSVEGIKTFLRGKPKLTDTVLFQNPSYTFFIRRRSAAPSGAGNVPLTAGYSIAVDRRYIPLGSCLLAAFPVFDNKKQRVIRHEYRILVAQDVGGAIRGPGHVDFYTGIGQAAARQAGNLNSYGQLWLLLPKKSRPAFISSTPQ